MHKGAEQLYAAYRTAGLTLEEMEARYQRISHIKVLMREGTLDADLRRRPRAAPRKAVADAVVA